MKLGYVLDPTRRVRTRCIYDDRVSAISFDEDGVCNYCTQLEGLVDQYSTGRSEGAAEFQSLLDQIKADGRGKKSDCIISMSGGSPPYRKAPTRIGDNCYLGPNAVIAAGVTIGDRAIVGANSLVLEDVAAGGMVVDNPARPIASSERPSDEGADA